MFLAIESLPSCAWSWWPKLMLITHGMPSSVAFWKIHCTPSTGLPFGTWIARTIASVACGARPAGTTTFPAPSRTSAPAAVAAVCVPCPLPGRNPGAPTGSVALAAARPVNSVPAVIAAYAALPGWAAAGDCSGATGARPWSQTEWIRPANAGWLASMPVSMMPTSTPLPPFAAAAILASSPG